MAHVIHEAVAKLELGSEAPSFRRICDAGHRGCMGPGAGLSGFGRVLAERLGRLLSWIPHLSTPGVSYEKVASAFQIFPILKQQCTILHADRQRAVVTTMNAVAKTLEDLKAEAGLSGSDIANLAQVSKATVSRWSTGKAAPVPGTQLVLSDLRYVAARLHEFYSADEARQWLYARNNLLGGETAMDLIHERRTEEVLEAIERLSTLTYI